MPAPDEAASSPRRRSLAIAAAVFVLAWAWLNLRALEPLHGDTSRDLAYARDLADATHLHLRGANSSFLFEQGTTWIDLLTLCRLAGLGPLGIRHVMTTLLAATVLLAYLGFRHLLPPSARPPAPELTPIPAPTPTPAPSWIRELAPVVGATVVLALVPLACEVPLLWQPTLLPLPVMLMHLAMWRLLRDGQLVDALALVIFAVVCFDVHVVCILLLALVVVVVPLASERPAIAIPAAIVLGLATLALCSAAALRSNVTKLAEQGWLVPAIVGLCVAVGLGLGGRRWFARLDWSRRLQVVLGIELLLVAALATASLLPDTPALTGRYLSPFLPALALAAALIVARTRSMLTVLVAGVLLYTSWGWLRLPDYRVLPSYPSWKLAEFGPIAETFVARGHTWSELVATLQGPESWTVLSHLSSIVDPGVDPGVDPARHDQGLLLVALAPDRAGDVLAEYGGDAAEVARFEVDPDMHALLLPTALRLDLLATELCRSGDACEAVELVRTERVLQAHPNAWRGERLAREWFYGDADGDRGKDAEILWRIPVVPGPRTILVLDSMMPDRCTWKFVATDGFSPAAGDPLPSDSLELGPDAEGSVLIARTPDLEDGRCVEYTMLPPRPIHTAPAWLSLRAALASND